MPHYDNLSRVLARRKNKPLGVGGGGGGGGGGGAAPDTLGGSVGMPFEENFHFRWILTSK